MTTSLGPPPNPAPAQRRTLSVQADGKDEPRGELDRISGAPLDLEPGYNT